MPDKNNIVFGGGNCLYVVAVGTKKEPGYKVQIIAGDYVQDASRVYKTLNGAKHKLFHLIADSYGIGTSRC